MLESKRHLLQCLLSSTGCQWCCCFLSTQSSNCCYSLVIKFSFQSCGCWKFLYAAFWWFLLHIRADARIKTPWNVHCYIIRHYSLFSLPCMRAFWRHEGIQGWSLCFSCWYACLPTSWIVAGRLIAGRLESFCGMNWSWNVYSCRKEIRICCYPCPLPCYACVFDVSTESLVGIRALFIGMRAYWRHERALFMTSVLPLRTMKTKHWRRTSEWGSDVPCTQTGSSTVLCICLLLPRRGVCCAVVHQHSCSRVFLAPAG
jgi:hypothetical protein